MDLILQEPLAWTRLLETHTNEKNNPVLLLLPTARKRFVFWSNLVQNFRWGAVFFFQNPSA